MTEPSALERRYRRWLALYPKTFRAEREEEMVAVLMQGAGPEQARPKVREAADLARHGLRRRVGRFPGDWEREHAKVMFPVRIAIAVWLCFISAMLIAYRVGEAWLIVLIPAIALHLYIAYVIRPRGPRPGQVA
jgi:hypothetical protein